MTYLVNLDFQKSAIDEYCFKQCKKIAFGAVIIDSLIDSLNFFPCEEENCDFTIDVFELETDDGEKYVVRKLRECE